MLPPAHQDLADLFFRLIADHGRFNERQLYRFVALKTGATLEPKERAALLSYAVSKGAKREQSIAPVYALPVHRERRPAGKAKALNGQLAFEGFVGTTSERRKGAR